MAVDFARHTGAFIDHFSVDTPATYTRAAGGSSFAVPYVQAEILAAFPDGAENAMEAVWARRSDFPATPARGDTFAAPGKTYRVVTVRSDRAGGVYLGLAS